MIPTYLGINCYGLKIMSLTIENQYENDSIAFATYLCTRAEMRRYVIVLNVGRTYPNICRPENIHSTLFVSVAHITMAREWWAVVGERNEWWTDESGRVIFLEHVIELLSQTLPTQFAYLLSAKLCSDYSTIEKNKISQCFLFH